MSRPSKLFLLALLANALYLSAADPGALYQKQASWAKSFQGALAADRGAPKEGRDARLSALKEALHRDFPAATASFLNINGSDLAAWFQPQSQSQAPAEFLQALRAKLASAPQEPYVSFVAKLDALAKAPPLEVLQAFETLVGKVQEANARDLPPIAWIKRPVYGLNGTNATMFSRSTSEGSEVCLWDPKKPGSSKTLLKTDKGFAWDLNPSWDASRLLISYKEKKEDPFGVWELSAGGQNFHRLTDGRYHDFNPVYYPDGRIVFCSSRVESYSLCQDFLASALHIINGDGSNLRRFDFTTLCTSAPAVMPDGSIIATRWEYQDKNIFMWQGLWTIHPDGRQLQLYYGNTITVPNSRYGGKPIPGTSKVLLTMAAHHFPPVGDIAVVDREKGIENPAAMDPLTHGTPYRIAQGKTWRDTNWQPGDHFYPGAYVDPMPIDARRFLVSYSGQTQPIRHRIFLLDYYGLGGPIIEDPKQSCFYAVPLTPRTPTRPITTEVPTTAGEGTFYVQNIYKGLAEQGVKEGQVKALRIMRAPPKKWNTEGPRYHDHYPLIGYGSYYVKENLGTVPVDPDGAVYFRAPSNCELYFIALDSAGKEIQRMGSVTQITTGETVTCVGCHEDRLHAPQIQSQKNLARLRRPADVITPPPWGAGNVDFVRQVQPVIDQYCLRCHEGRTPAAGMDLSGDKNRFFNMAYESLTQGGQVAYYYINPGPTGVFPALQSGSMVSKLTELIESGHKGRVAMDDLSRQRIYAWIDANIPYYGTWDLSRPHTIGGRDTWSFCTDNQRVTPKLEAWVVRLEETYTQAGCMSCHPKLVEEHRGHGSDARWGNAHVNLTRPEMSRLLNAHLAKEAGGMGLAGKRKGVEAPRWATTSDKVYLEILAAIREGQAALAARPRMDMPGGQVVPQVRNFAKTY